MTNYCSELIIGTSFLVVFISPQNAPVDVRNSHKPEFSVAADAYFANRESFAHFSCRFAVTEGRATTIDKALRGEFIDPVVTRALWIVDGTKVKYQMDGPRELLAQAFSNIPKKAKTKIIQVGLPFDAQGLLTDGDIHLQYAPLINCANVYPPDRVHPGVQITPFGMGIMGAHERFNPGVVLRDCAADKVLANYDGIKSIDGVEALCFSRGGPDDYWVRYFMDPKQGFQPVEIWGRSGRAAELEYKAFITYQECSNSRWFPKRSVIVWRPERKDPPFHIREIIVNELDADRHPAKNEFSLKISAGTQVSTPEVNPGYFKLTEEREVTLEDLKPMLARCVANDGQTMKSVGSKRLVYLWVLVINLLAIGALVGTRLYRRFCLARK